MIKDILTVVDNAEESDGFLGRFAVAAKRMKAHSAVTVLTPSPMISPALAPFGSIYLPDYELRHDASIAMAQVKMLVGDEQPKADIGGTYGDVAWLTHGLKAEEATADLIVITAEEAWSVRWLRRRVIETLLLSSGTPVLLLPAGGDVPIVGKALLGWKRSREARRAMRDMIACVEPRATIEVASVGDGAGFEAPPDAPCGIVDHLRRHGFEASRTYLNRAGSTGDTLQAAALELGADLLVVGGFAHSRVREIMLGGVTRSLIQHPRLPILMSH